MQRKLRRKKDACFLRGAVAEGDATKALALVREHWSVKNNLHLPLDVVFEEDDARARKNHAPQSLAFIRRMALDISNAEQRILFRNLMR